jgi:hypothetical protein
MLKAGDQDIHGGSSRWTDNADHVAAHVTDGSSAGKLRNRRSLERMMSRNLCSINNNFGVEALPPEQRWASDA